MDDPFGNAICLGVTGVHAGRMYFWDHENEPDDDWNGEVESAGNLQLLANSFTDFVAGLKHMDDDDERSGTDYCPRPHGQDYSAQTDQIVGRDLIGRHFEAVIAKNEKASRLRYANGVQQDSPAVAVLRAPWVPFPQNSSPLARPSSR